MNPRDDHPDDWQSLRKKIIGLGEKSIRKSYYPELRQRLTDFENFYTLMNHVSDAIFIFDVDTLRITDANRSACALIGDAVEKIRSLTLPRICPDIRIAEHQIVPSVTRCVRMDQTEIPVELTIQVIRSEKNQQGVVVARDIRERLKTEELLRKSEKRYRQFFNENVSGAYLCRPDGVLLAANPAFVRMLGFETVDELLSQNMMSLFQDENSFLEFLSALKRYKKLRHHPATLVSKTGEPLYVIENVSCLISKTGEMEEIRGYVMDLSEQKRLENRLYQSSKMEAIGTLAGGIAHDFNNILMAIQGCVSLLLLECTRDLPHFDLLKKIERQVEKAGRLTSQLLGFARKGRYEIQLVNLNLLAADAVEIISRTRKNITVFTELEKDLPAIKADRSQMEQVVMNLCINAADAMPDGGKLVLKTRTTLESDFSHALFSVHPGWYVVMAVEDTGAGMSEETLQRIFEPFYTTKSFGKGTGLGLASVYGIVKSHGGTLSVDTRKGIGSRFVVYFPATDKAAGRVLEIQQPISRGKGNILLVDDEEIIRDVGSQMLEYLGYGVKPASCGKDAVRLYREQINDIGLVMLDLVMPGMNGSETFDAIKAINPSAKILLCSGFSAEDRVPEMIGRGCAGFIQKPFSLGALSQKLKEIFG